MFCVVSGEVRPSMGIFERLRRVPMWRVEPVSFLSCVKLIVEFPVDYGGEKRYKLAMKAFTAVMAKNVSGVVPDDGFEYLPHGLPVYSPSLLYRRMAGKICKWAAGELGLAPRALRVGLIGSRVSPEMAGAVEYLRERAASFSINAGRDTEAFCLGLQRRFGISARANNAADSDIVLIFERQTRPLTAKGLVIDLTGGVPAVRGGLWVNGARLFCRRTFAGFERLKNDPVFLAAAMASGGVGAEDIEIESLTACGSSIRLIGAGGSSAIIREA